MPLKDFISFGSSEGAKETCCSLAPPVSRREITMLLAPRVKAMRMVKSRQLPTTSSLTTT
ncbi:MAG TPA: hypothetical protein PLE54_10525 [Burkholderiaceae bacterium]|nr:hypothetical protein [Burkholderiaceae bacterium]